MACTRQNQLPTSAEGSDLGPASNPIQKGGPCLILSNAPETLGNQAGMSDTGVLYLNDQFKLFADKPKKFRLFLWHINKRGSDLTFSLLLSSSDATASIQCSGISYTEREVAENSDYSIPGLCLATSHSTADSTAPSRTLRRRVQKSPFGTALQFTITF